MASPAVLQAAALQVAAVLVAQPSKKSTNWRNGVKLTLCYAIIICYYLILCVPCFVPIEYAIVRKDKLYV